MLTLQSAICLVSARKLMNLSLLLWGEGGSDAAPLLRENYSSIASISIHPLSPPLPGLKTFRERGGRKTRNTCKRKLKFTVATALAHYTRLVSQAHLSPM